MKPCAYNLTRQDTHYRHASFSAGLRAAGFQVSSSCTSTPKPGDVLLIWNRYGHFDSAASEFERRGGTVIVAENGYIGRDQKGGQLYALAKRGHNGSGTWNVGEADRWSQLGIELQPWRDPDPYSTLVIRGQRGIGSRSMASPPGWMGKTAQALSKYKGRRAVMMVPHPGNGAESNRDHEKYLQGAHSLIVWSSSVGVKALAMGIPVFFDAPYWICSDAALRFSAAHIDTPKMNDQARLQAMQRMAWAQWRLDEIESGEAFQELLK